MTEGRRKWMIGVSNKVEGLLKYFWVISVLFLDSQSSWEWQRKKKNLTEEGGKWVVGLSNKAEDLL